MKSIFCILSLLMAISFGSMYAADPEPSAAKQTVRVKTSYKDKSQHISRAPLILNIEVTYDENLHYLSLSTDSEADAEVYLYKDEVLIGYAPEINCTFDVYEYGEYVIVIDSDAWAGEFVLDL